MKYILEGFTKDGPLSSNLDDACTVDDTEKMVSGQKLKLGANPIRTENVQKRIQQIFDDRLKKFQEGEFNEGVHDLNELDKMPEKANGWWAERASSLSELIDRLNRARSEEDLKLCLEMKAQLYSQDSRSSRTETKDAESFKEQTSNSDMAPRKELDYCSRKIFRTVEIDQEALERVDAHFSSLEKIEDL